MSEELWTRLRVSTCSARISPGRRKSTEPPRFRRPRPVAAARRPRRRRPSVSGKNPKPRADQQILARPVDPGSGGHGEKPGGLRRACSPCLQGTLVDLSRGVAYRSEMALLPWRAFLWDFGVRDVGPRTHVWSPGAPSAAGCHPPPVAAATQRLRRARSTATRCAQVDALAPACACNV